MVWNKKVLSQGRLVDFVYKKCSGFTGTNQVVEEVAINGDVLAKMAKFLYLGDVLSSGGGMQEAERKYV